MWSLAASAAGPVVELSPALAVLTRAARLPSAKLARCAQVEC